MWLAAAEIPYPLHAAGPFEPADALRAWRLANVLIPDGCERYGWQSALALFRSGPPPGELTEWTRLDASRLEPSLSEYTAQHLADAGAGASAWPKVRWAPAGHEIHPLVESTRAAHPALHSARIGRLARAWNVHPAGSPILLPGAVLESGLWVIDLPPDPVPPRGH